MLFTSQTSKEPDGAIFTSLSAEKLPRVVIEIGGPALNALPRLLMYAQWWKEYAESFTGGTRRVRIMLASSLG